jgi:hypothetical protein
VVEALHTPLAQRNAAFRPDLAMSLCNLGSIQSELGQQEAALEATQEAIQILRPSSGSQPPLAG